MNIRVAIDDLEAWSITREFELSEYNSMGRVTALIKEWKDVMSEVSDHQALVNSVKENKYAGRFRGEIEKYEGKLSLLEGALVRLNQIQRKWIYLEPIFMRGALPEEQGRWRRLDEDYRNIMHNVAANHHVIELANIAGFLDTLSTIMAQLERCQKALNDFLEEKRNKFPRFYFLGDDDMLEILGQSQNPAIIQLHLKKLFSGIHTVLFTEHHEKILAMRSHLRE
jgi:dynein heavy chain 2, cytosolic